MHSVEFIFDADTEAAVRGIWDGLREAGIPSQAPASRPHTTLAVAQHIDPAVETVLLPVTDRFPLSCRIGATLIFGRTSGVLGRLLLPSPEILDVHAYVYRSCAPLMAPGPVPHTEPGHWTPHVTLARRIPPAKLAAALRIAGRPAEITGKITGLRRWDGDHRTEHLIG